MDRSRPAALYPLLRIPHEKERKGKEQWNEKEKLAFLRIGHANKEQQWEDLDPFFSSLSLEFQAKIRIRTMILVRNART